MFKVLWKTDQQGVVAPVWRKVRYRQRIQRHTFHEWQPRNMQSALKQHRFTHIILFYTALYTTTVCAPAWRVDGGVVLRAILRFSLSSVRVVFWCSSLMLLSVLRYVTFSDVSSVFSVAYGPFLKLRSVNGRWQCGVHVAWLRTHGRTRRPSSIASTTNVRPPVACGRICTHITCGRRLLCVTWSAV